MNNNNSNNDMRAALISLGSKSSRWTLEAMQRYFGHVDNINIKNIQIKLESKRPQIIYDGKPLEKYDCIFAKGSFRYADLLSGVKLISDKTCFIPYTENAFHVGHDKILTHLWLQKKNIPMPTTYISSNIKTAKKILEEITYPIIIKLPRGTQGKGVMFAESFSSASSFLDTLEALRQPFLIQEFIDTDGEDIRAIVIGNKVVAAMKRVAAASEARANVHAGGTTKSCFLDPRTQKIAIDAAQAIGADICGVDILESIKGPVVLEVNLSPGLQGITTATNIDVADKIAQYLYEGTKQKLFEKNAESTDIMETLGIAQQASPEKEIITNIDIKNNKIVLPKIITDITNFTLDEEVRYTIKKGKLVVEKFL
jgi:ribosomal protein S6--L-glutamate ligase